MRGLLLFFLIIFTYANVNAQCSSFPYLTSGGGGGTLYFSDSSSVTSGWSTNYSVSYQWDFKDGFTSNQQSPCHTYGDLSNVTAIGGVVYPTLTVTFIDSTTFNFCQVIDSVAVLFQINPCVYGNLQISASGNNLTANTSYSTNVCSNVYPNTFLWSTGDTTQTINVNTAGTYTCTVVSNVGCIYTASYTYNGSLTPTFDCNLIDINELYNNQDTLTIFSNYLNNNFPEVIDTLSFWEGYSTDGNVNLLAPINANPASFLNIGGFNGIICDTFIICANIFLYDSLYQFNLNSGIGSACTECDTLIWDGIVWNTYTPNSSWDCDPVIGCYNTGPSGPWGGQFNSYSSCEAFCNNTYNNSICDSIDVTVINFSTNTITFGVNFNSPNFNLINYSWDEWYINGLGVFNPTNSSPTPTFSLTQNDSAIYYLEVELLDSLNNSVFCSYIFGVAYNFGTPVPYSATANPPSTNTSLTNPKKQRNLVKIIDLYGREITKLKNQPLFYIYDDGTVEKKIIFE